MSDPFMSAMGTAASGMSAQGTRIRVVAENVANAQTPGYRRKQLTFEEVGDGKETRLGTALGRPPGFPDHCPWPQSRAMR